MGARRDAMYASIGRPGPTAPQPGNSPPILSGGPNSRPQIQPPGGAQPPFRLPPTPTPQPAQSGPDWGMSSPMPSTPAPSPWAGQAGTTGGNMAPTQGGGLTGLEGGKPGLGAATPIGTMQPDVPQSQPMAQMGYRAAPDAMTPQPYNAPGQTQVPFMQGQSAQVGAGMAGLSTMGPSMGLGAAISPDQRPAVANALRTQGSTPTLGAPSTSAV